MIYCRESHTNGSNLQAPSKKFGELWGTEWNCIKCILFGKAVDRLGCGIGSDYVVACKILSLAKSFMSCSALHWMQFSSRSRYWQILKTCTRIYHFPCWCNWYYIWRHFYNSCCLHEGGLRLHEGNQINVLPGLTLIILAAATFISNKFFNEVWNTYIAPRISMQIKWARSTSMFRTVIYSNGGCEHTWDLMLDGSYRNRNRDSYFSICVVWSCGFNTYKSKRRKAIAKLWKKQM